MICLGVIGYDAARYIQCQNSSTRSWRSAQNVYVNFYRGRFTLGEGAV